MFRTILTAAILTATAATAHQHWGDLDGDGFLEPDEFDIGEFSFEDADTNNDGLISPGEYDALLALSLGDDNIAVPEGATPGETGLEASRVEGDIEPEIIDAED
jgi:hypothetical protein